MAYVSCVSVGLTSVPELRVLGAVVSCVSADHWRRLHFVGDFVGADDARSPSTAGVLESLAVNPQRRPLSEQLATGTGRMYGRITGVTFAHKLLPAWTQLGHAQTAEPMRAIMMAPFASVRPVREPRFRSTLSDVTARTIERVPRQKAITHNVSCQPDGPSQSTLPDSGVNVVAAAGMLITVAINAATAARKVQRRGGTSAGDGMETSGRGGGLSACGFESPFF